MMNKQELLLCLHKLCRFLSFHKYQILRVTAPRSNEGVAKAHKSR